MLAPESPAAADHGSEPAIPTYPTARSTTLSVCVAIGLAASCAVVRASPAAPPFYIGFENCLVVQPQQELTAGTRLIALAARRPASGVTVHTVQPWAPDSRNEPGRADRNCAAAVQRDLSNDDSSEKPAALARITPSPAEDSRVFFAVDADILALGGEPKPVDGDPAKRLIETFHLALPGDWPPDRVLVRGYRYGPTRGHVAMEIYAGLPTLSAAGGPPAIERIAIRRYYIIDGRLLAAQAYQRTSGVEERAETEAPELTFDNWSESDTEATVAFVSRDRGHSWMRLSTDVGFEGVNWIAQRLEPGTPTVLHAYLYTPH